MMLNKTKKLLLLSRSRYLLSNSLVGRQPLSSSSSSSSSSYNNYYNSHKHNNRNTYGLLSLNYNNNFIIIGQQQQQLSFSFSSQTTTTTTTTTTTRCCWNCSNHQTSPFLVCNKCSSIQPFDPTIDYFQIFGLDKTYEIGDVNLQSIYKDWQKRLHPDLVHSKSEKERGYAALQSARVIDAYRTLTNPLTRAMYILKLQGIIINEEETISDPELLAEVMEIREAVEEAPDSQALKQIQSQVQEKMKLWSDSFANAFRNQKYEEAITAIRRMTYYDRVDEEIVKRL